MAKAPVVQKLNDLISQYTKAYAPQATLLDTQIAANENSGAAQTTATNLARDQAFDQYDQGASNNGMFFSGQSAHNQAGYVGNTYIPALAKIQSAIASARDTLLGNKATLATNANTNAQTTLQGQKESLNSWDATQQQIAAQKALELQQEKAAAKAAATARTFTAKQNTLNRA